MDFQEIEKELYALTPHEQVYLDNMLRIPHLIERLPELTEAEFRQHGLLFNIYNPVEMELRDSFGVKKHSRFNFIAEHKHSYIEINYIYSGQMKEIVNGQEIILEAGDVMILDTNVKHQFFAAGEKDIMVSFLISQDFLKKNILQFESGNYLSDFFLKSIFEGYKYNRYLLISMKDKSFFQELVLSIMYEFEHPGLENKAMLTHYLMILFIQLARAEQKIATTSEDEQLNSEEYLHFQFTSYIKENIKDISLKKMAEDFGYHVNYLSKLIKKTTGYSFTDFLIDARLSNSLRLLSGTSLSIQDIARKSGFTNLNFFYKKFKERFGETPKNYRKLLKE